MSIPSASGTHRAHLIVLAVVCFLVFFNSLTNDLVWDDIPLIKENSYLRDYKHIPRFLTPRYWNDQHPYAGHYRPLRTISLAVDYFFWGLNPIGYRLTNLLLHTVNVILVYFLVVFIGRREAGRLAFFTALLFAVHPVHTESINLVKNRSDLLAFMFFVISFLLFVKQPTSARKGSRWILIAAWCSFVPAVLSKEMALTLPGVLVLYVVCFLPGPERGRSLTRIIPYAGIVAVYFWFMCTFITPAAPLPAGVVLPSGPVRQIWTVIKTTGIYLKMLAVPYPLKAEHPFVVPSSLSDPLVLPSLILILLVLITAVGTYRRAPVVCFALGWILLTLVPAANLVYLVSRPIAEQRLYIPSFGLCLLLGYAVTGLRQRRSARSKPGKWAVAGVLLYLMAAGLYAGLTMDRNRDWRDEITFYTRTLAANPDSPRMHNNLGIALNRAGRYEAAVDHFRTALRLDPDYAKPHLNLGSTYFNMGRYREAVDHFQAGLMLKRDKDDRHYLGVYNNLGVAQMHLGQMDAAIRHFARVLEADPDNIDAGYNLGVALMRGGDYPEAGAWFSRVLTINPAHVQAARAYEYCLKMMNAKSQAVIEK